MAWTPPGDVSKIAAQDTARLQGSVAKCLAQNSPFIGVLKGGTFPAGISDSITTSTEQPAMPGDAKAIPDFVDKSAVASSTPTYDRTAKINLTYKLQAKRGRGPKVDVNNGFYAFKSSYLAAEDSLRKLITQYINADVQAQLWVNSFSKFSAYGGGAQNSVSTRTVEQNLGTNLTTAQKFDWGSYGAPDAPLTFKCLHAIARKLKEGLLGEMFPSDGKTTPHFKFIGSAEIIEAMRNEAGIENVLVSLTTGGYKVGESWASGYSWETSPAFRGIAFGINHRPLRMSATTLTNGMPALVDPVTVVENDTDKTAYAVPNSSWETAGYEVGFLIADNTFERLTPEQYTGEGTFKWAPQLYGGELEWHCEKDNSTNMWGDYGWHKYQITRAYRPVRPQHIIPIWYYRPTTSIGLSKLTP